MPKSERQRQIDRCDNLCSEYIRKRAMVRVHGCERCLTYKQDYKELQAAHCFTKQGRLATRYDIDNLAGLCGGCHIYIDSHEDTKFELFRRLIGDSQRFERLYLLSSMTSKQSPVDLKLTEVTFKALIKELDSCYVTTH